MRMVSEEEAKENPQEEQKRSNPVEDGQNTESLFSPGFKSVAAMAGWDEESIIVASLIVEDTPEREFKHKRRSVLNFKTPPSTDSRRKRRNHRKSPVSIPVPVLNLEEGEESARKGTETEKMKAERKLAANEENNLRGNELEKENPGVSCPNAALPCMDKLREEFSCAICLEMCFEPSTTPCGHSFCKKCLRSAADKCGKRCPKCRQLISNGRSCTVNTVLWNTIQLLFPQEVEARKATGASNSRETELQTPTDRVNNYFRSQISRYSRNSSRDRSLRSRGTVSLDEGPELALSLPEAELTRIVRRDAAGGRSAGTLRQDEDPAVAQRLQRREALSRLLTTREAGGGRRRGTPGQDEDAALALRLQREEFMEAFRGTNEQSGSSISSARANLRAMASRALIRTRDRRI
ncbi:hypothetical protein Tsubulata_003287 [Turnera subulata]|uniref:RING-type E3 ubiquitin transferase n=1 Tax=Turnera subulata TaxID=218843 RepID=A0A9Q0FAW8_9ROSI|nr:hypothetical protein Tsubulata_003287 [Turnera subulata]